MLFHLRGNLSGESEDDVQAFRFHVESTWRQQRRRLQSVAIGAGKPQVHDDMHIRLKLKNNSPGMRDIYAGALGQQVFCNDDCSRRAV